MMDVYAVGTLDDLRLVEAPSPQYAHFFFVKECAQDKSAGVFVAGTLAGGAYDDGEAEEVNATLPGTVYSPDDYTLCRFYDPHYQSVSEMLNYPQSMDVSTVLVMHLMADLTLIPVIRQGVSTHNSYVKEQLTHQHEPLATAISLLNESERLPMLVYIESLSVGTKEFPLMRCIKVLTVHEAVLQFPNIILPMLMGHK